MMLAVKGIYHAGEIHLLEKVNAPSDAHVVVVFPDEATLVPENGGLMELFGCLKDSPAFKGDPVAMQQEMRHEWDD